MKTKVVTYTNNKRMGRINNKGTKGNKGGRPSKARRTEA